MRELHEPREHWHLITNPTSVNLRSLYSFSRLALHPLLNMYSDLILYTVSVRYGTIRKGKFVIKEECLKITENCFCYSTRESTYVCPLHNPKEQQIKCVHHLHSGLGEPIMEKHTISGAILNRKQG